jgi:hypothetical protein
VGKVEIQIEHLPDQSGQRPTFERVVFRVVVMQAIA